MNEIILTKHGKSIRVGSLVKINKITCACTNYLKIPFEGRITSCEDYTDSYIKFGILSSSPYGWWDDAYFMIDKHYFNFETIEDVNAIEIIEY